MEAKIQFQKEEAAFPLKNALDFLSPCTASVLHSGLTPEYLMAVGGGWNNKVIVSFLKNQRERSQLHSSSMWAVTNYHRFRGGKQQFISSQCCALEA